MTGAKKGEMVIVAAGEKVGRSMLRTSLTESGCPNPDCKDDGSSLEGHQIEVQGNQAFQPCHCNACGTEWEDEYTLTNVVNVKIGGSDG